VAPAEEEEEDNFIIAAFKDRSRSIWHRIFVSQTGGWVRATFKYVALCIGGFFLLVAVLAVFECDADAISSILIFAALVTIAYVIG